MHKLYTIATRDVTWSTLDDDLKVFLTAHPDEAEADGNSLSASAAVGKDSKKKTTSV